MKVEKKIINGKEEILIDGRTGDERMRELPEYKDLSPAEYKAAMKVRAKEFVDEAFKDQARIY